MQPTQDLILESLDLENSSFSANSSNAWSWYPTKTLPQVAHPCVGLSVGKGLGFVEKADRVLGLCVGGIRSLVDGRPSPLFAMCLVTSLLALRVGGVVVGKWSPHFRFCQARKGIGAERSTRLFKYKTSRISFVSGSCSSTLRPSMAGGYANSSYPHWSLLESECEQR